MPDKLVDFKPRWVNAAGRTGIGVIFRCLTGHCDGWILVLFSNPLDGGPAHPGNSRDVILELYRDEAERYKVIGCGENRWHRDGTDLTTLTLRPSVNAYECGHKTLTAGEWQP